MIMLRLEIWTFFSIH